MSNRPDMEPRQWWLLHSYLARIDCENERDVSRYELRYGKTREDIRRLAAEGCIAVLPGRRRGQVRVTVLKRGELWVERWRKEQVEFYVRSVVPSPDEA